MNKSFQVSTIVMVTTLLLQTAVAAVGVYYISSIDKSVSVKKEGSK